MRLLLSEPAALPTGCLGFREINGLRGEPGMRCAFRAGPAPLPAANEGRACATFPPAARLRHSTSSTRPLRAWRVTAAFTCRRTGRCSMPRRIAALAGRPYAEVACELISLFAADAVKAGELARMICEAYDGFRHPAVVPLVQLGPSCFVLELFHGPTLAFKDLAMQFLGRLIDHVLGMRDERSTVIVATSGDTGGAAVAAFAGRPRVDVVALFPNGRISEVQRRMITTSAADNVHAIAIEGTFDDCQALVKAMFNHQAFRERVRLSGVNSINFARIAAQVVYYFVAAVALGAPHRQSRLHGSHRQFRQCVRGLCGGPHGPAGQAVHHRHQRQRHSGALHGHRRLRIARGEGDDVAVDGHRGLVKFRAADVRGLWPRSATGPRRHGSPGAVAPIQDRRARARRHSHAVHRRSRSRRRDRSGDPHHVARDRLPPRSPHRRRRRRRRKREPRFRDAHGGARDRASGQVSRRRRGRLRRPPGAARLACGPRSTGRSGSPCCRPISPPSKTTFSPTAAPRAKECLHERRSHPSSLRTGRGHRCDGASGDRLARRLGDLRQPPRAGRRARHLAFPRAHGVQGHGAPHRAPDRRGDRSGRRGTQCRHRRRDDGLLRAGAQGGYRA